jgi:hypothetical protein
MIVSWLTGGLGNQMFQYAAGLALARRLGTELKLDASWYEEASPTKPHEQYGLSVFACAPRIATRAEINRTRGVPPRRLRRWADSAARALHLLPPAVPGNWHTPPVFRFYPEFYSQPDNTYLHGMFQSEKFFASVADEVRGGFRLRLPPPPTAAALADRIRSGPSAAIHFRRGDYVRDPTYARDIGPLGLDYYLRAVRLLRERSPGATLYVFSDDIETVAREFAPDGNHVFVRTEPTWSDAESLRLMSQCDHFAIANSTFSWWAAWLNPSPDKLVVAPEPWFDQSRHDASDVIPASWVKLPRQS